MERELWIRVLRWKEHQHYKDRDPRWIKNHTQLLENDDYLTLSPRTRSLLHGTWILYASASRTLRADTRRLSSALNQQVRHSDLELLEDAGFIVLLASKELAKSEHDDTDALVLAHSQEERREELSPTLVEGSSSSSPYTDDQDALRTDVRAPDSSSSNGEYLEPDPEGLRRIAEIMADATARADREKERSMDVDWSDPAVQQRHAASQAALAKIHSEGGVE